MEGGVTPFSSSMAPSGSYILIVVNQPLSEGHKQIILERLNKGLLSWDVSSTGCDLSGLEYALSSNIKDSVTESDVLIQHSTESLGVEVLLSPTVRTLKQCVKNLLSTPTSHKQLVHAGYTFAGSGSWILENGTFSFQEFLGIFKQADVQSQKRCTINVHCAEVGEWNKTNFSKDIFTKVADISLNPPEKVNHVPGSEHLIKCLDSALITQSLEEMMKPSPLVGNIRFNRPTIYMFPAGQGDCALFGINGFNMLIDGGFYRKPCSWDFVRHLDRLDAVLVTRIGESNVCGMSTLMKRNALNNANPQIGYVFCNIAENKPNPLKNGAPESNDDLIVSVVGEGHNFVQTLNDLKLKPHQCWRDSSIDPFVLYHKVGQGTLEMHVLSPPRDSKEMKSFLSEWNVYKETFSGVKSELKGVEKMIPLSHATSICAILVWRPEDPKDTITRILFPGSAPQGKILEGLEKLKVLNILNQPVVTKASLNIPSSKIISNKIEKSVSRASIPNRNHTASPALSVSSHASKNGDIGGLKKDVKKITKDIKKENKEVKKEVKKDVKKDVVKDIKKEIKSENTAKKDLLSKKESVKDSKKETKEIKKVVKKEVKAVAEKKEIKSTPKKESTAPTTKATAEIKRTTSVAKKSTTPVKKDVGKPPIAPKVADTKKSVSKVSEQKTKEVTNKKSIESKTVNKTKPKSTTPTPKTTATPKTKPVSVQKPGSKMTKAVAASSIVASVVAVTAAAFELNEKKEDIVDTEPEISEKEADVVIEPKETVEDKKSVDDVISPLPLEALSPTPSDSVSLTPSDTLSSAPLETVSPTPPLPNEPISTEEKDVNEIKDLEQDMPFEHGKTVEETETQNAGNDDLKTENDVNDIEVELAKLQASSDAMSTSFIAEKQVEDVVVEKQFEKAEFRVNESAPTKVLSDNEDLSENDTSAEIEIAAKRGVIEEKYVVDMNEKDVDDARETFEEKDIADEKDVVEEKDISEEKDIVEERVLLEEKDIAEERDLHEEKNISEERDLLEEKNISEERNLLEENDIAEERDLLEENDIAEERDLLEEKHIAEKEDLLEEKNIAEERDSPEEKAISEQKETVEQEYSFEETKVVEERETVEEAYTNEEKDVIEEKYDAEEKDVTEEKDIVEEKETDDYIDIVEEKDEIKEKDTIEDSNINVHKDMVEDSDDTNLIDENECNNSYKVDAKEVDDQLAGLSMEGSFCAGMMSSTDRGVVSATETEFAQLNEKESYDPGLNYGENIAEEHYEKKIVSESESYFKSKNSELYVLEKQEDPEFSGKDTVATGSYDAQYSEHDTHPNISVETEEQNRMSPDVKESFSHDDNMKKYVNSENKQDFGELSEELIENKEAQFGNFSQLHSMTASFHQDTYDNYEPTNIDDLDMQETSVDEPEEIVRKESVVSITLNDENTEENYVDNWRRKSGTESEDDVDIGKYMCKEPTVEEDKLCIQRGSDSDEEDVVKSPTPHAVVDYEGQLDELTSTKQSSETDGKEIYINEKEDFDEKDRDSAEEQDTDDGEMIRHPTPPGMKYSEEEMRDPIGQHFITNPSLKPQGTDITEQPLYEEAEDSASERSASPIIEQPVFGSVVQADFPELVTVSGGTTPSEPQSPKANFDLKKFATEAAVMEALSEHDLSESSTHSPSCQDGSTAFDLQGSERSVIEVQSLQDDDVLKTVNETKLDMPLNNAPMEQDRIPEIERSVIVEATAHDDNDDNTEDKQETPSDEEESSSEDENSESHSKDKSDAMGDRSDVERDDRSDIHNDDKSDHHHDGKSDVVNDDDDNSDIHDDEQLYRQQNRYMEHELDDGSQKNLKMDPPSEMEVQYDKPGDNCEKQCIFENSPKVYEQSSSNFESETDLKVHAAFSETHFENISTEKLSEKKDDTFEAKPNEASNKEELLNPSSYERDITNINYDSREKETCVDSRHMSEFESTYASENYGSNFHYESSNEVIINKASVSSDYDLTNAEMQQVDEMEKEDEIEDRENNFRPYEADFDNSKSTDYIRSFNNFNDENTIETTSINAEAEDSRVNISDYSPGISSGFGNFEHHESAILKDRADLHVDLQPPEDVSEKQILSEISDAHQYDNLSEYEENKQISAGTYSESTLITNVITGENMSEAYRVSTEEINVNESDFGHDVHSQIKSYSSGEYEYSSETVSDKINDIGRCQENESYDATGIINEPYDKTSHFEYETENTVKSFNSTNTCEQLTDSHSHSNDHEQFLHGESHIEKKLPSESTSEYFQREITETVASSGYTSEVTDINFNGSESISDFTVVNGKEQTSFSLPPSEFLSSELPHEESIISSTQEIEQESTYLINHRFQSDSPEDNTMRSDSSPDVPYPADLPDKFSEIKNSMSVETHSETYIHNTEDFKNNMNFSGTEGIPLSPHNHPLNANQNSTFAESSEDEGNTHLRGNVSPYAYTNKAYTREEEDIDGNHIYKEETTEILKQVEYDGNLQALSTNQVSSVMNYSQEYQDVQYSTGANYDFHLEEWGKPMGLPTPPDSSQKTAKKSDKVTVKSKTAVDANGKAHFPSVSSKLSSPLKKPKPKVAKESSSSPIYVDLAYVPQHADPHYCDVEFFKKIRARYYVISSVNPSKEVLNALLEAKKTWNEDLSVTIIPTYETDTLGYWMAQNQDDLAEYSIDVSPSASRCTVNLQDHQTSCSAYRLEF